MTSATRNQSKKKIAIKMRRLFQLLKHHEKHLQTGLILLIFMFMGWSLVKNYHQISDYEWNINYTLLALATTFAVTNYFLLAGTWGLIIGEYAPDIAWPKYLSIWLQSLLAKYLPGSIWNLVGRVYLCKKANVTGLAPIVSIALETILSLLAQIIIILVLSSLYLPTLLPLWMLWPVILLLIISIGIVIYPKVFSGILQLLIKRKSKTLEKLPRIRLPSLLAWLSLYILIYIIGGVSFFLFITSIYVLPLSLGPTIVVIINLSLLISLLTPFAPNGLGIREGLLALLLSYYMPSPIAIMVSFASRLWLTLGEIISVGLGNFILPKFRP